VSHETFEAADQQAEHADLHEGEQWIASSILKDYPNPTRIGCQGLETIKSLAKRAAAFDGFVKDAGWEHVRNCFPSYQEFLVVDAIEVVEGVYRSECAGLWPRSSGGPSDEEQP